MLTSISHLRWSTLGSWATVLTCTLSTACDDANEIQQKVESCHHRATPDTHQLQSIAIGEAEVSVRYLGQNWFWDYSPGDGLDRPEVFVLGNPHGPQAKMKMKDAGPCERQQATAFYQAGLRFAQRHLKAFDEAFQRWEGMAFRMQYDHASHGALRNNPLMNYEVTYPVIKADGSREHRTGHFAIYPEYEGSDVSGMRLHQLNLKIGHVSVTLDDREQLQTYQEKIEPLYVQEALRVQETLRQRLKHD